MNVPLIVTVIEHYHPSWEAPPDNGREWQPCLCPWHGDTTESAAVSYRHQAFNCLACPVKGDAIGLIMREEGMAYRQAVEVAAGLSPEGVAALPQRTTGVRSGGVPRNPRSGRPGYRRGGSEVPSGLRRGSATWA